MMNNKKLTILAVIALVMVVLAVLQSRIANRPPAADRAPQYLIQGLDPDDIATIVLGTGDDTITLKRQSGRFVVVEKDNYPVLNREINNVITACLDVRTAELYTDDPENHEHDSRVPGTEPRLEVPHVVKGRHIQQTGRRFRVRKQEEVGDKSECADAQQDEHPGLDFPCSAKQANDQERCQDTFIVSTIIHMVQASRVRGRIQRCRRKGYRASERQEQEGPHVTLSVIDPDLAYGR